MVCFIIEDNDMPLPTERAADSAHHLVVGFIKLGTTFTKDFSAERAHIGIFPVLEGVVVRDDNLRARECLLVS